jgi:cation diffusion facilitator family transporter
MKKDRESQIAIVSLIGVAGNAVLAAAKVVIGVLAGSLSLIADGIDSVTDIFTSAIGYFAAKIMRKPPDPDHPYGHGRVESIGTKVVAFVIIMAGIELGRRAVTALIHGGEYSTPGIAALIAAGVSIVGKTLLALLKFKKGRKLQSMMLVADAKNMRNDVAISSTVFLGLLFSKVLNLPILDPVAALFVSVWIVFVGIQVFTESLAELMEGYKNKDDYRKIFDLLDDVVEVSNPHKLRIRTVNNMLIIDLDVEVDPEMKVVDAHNISMKIESLIKNNLENVYDVLVHIEPLGNIEHSESYGVSRSEIEPT